MIYERIYLFAILKCAKFASKTFRVKSTECAKQIQRQVLEITVESALKIKIINCIVFNSSIVPPKPLNVIKIPCIM